MVPIFVVVQLLLASTIWAHPPISGKGKSSKSVIVVGGGVSGLIAATTLRKTGEFDVVVLEADDHVGGRLKSRKIGDHFVEFGAEFVHGEKGNTVFEILNPLGLLNTSNGAESFVFEYDEDIFATQYGEVMSEEYNENMARFMNAMYDDESHGPNTLNFTNTGEFVTDVFNNFQKDNPFHRSRSIQQATLNWIQINTNTENAADHWSQTSHGAPGEQFEYPEGNMAVIFKSNSTYSALLNIILGQPFQQSPEKLIVPDWVKLGKQVTNIDYSKPDAKVVVTCTDGSTLEADHVLSTVSLGVLKEQHTALFTPNLSPKKQLAIENIGFGTVNKIYLEFENAWWKQIPDFAFESIQLLWDEIGVDGNWFANSTTAELLREKDGIPIWCRSLLNFGMVASKSHPKVLQGWIPGASSRFMETLSLENVTDTSMNILRRFLRNRFSSIPAPIRYARSTWSTNPFTRGSYSFRSVDSERLDVWARDLAEPILNSKGKPIVTFAGEATSIQHFSTVNGAYDSGVREAKRIIEFYAQVSSSSSNFRYGRELSQSMLAVTLILTNLIRH